MYIHLYLLTFLHILLNNSSLCYWHPEKEKEEEEKKISTNHMISLLAVTYSVHTTKSNYICFTHDLKYQQIGVLPPCH